MTDPARIPTQPPATPDAGQTPNRRGTLQGSAASPRRRHPLLSAFPLTVMTLATFLVVFALMMARLQAGADPALRASAPSALVAGRSGAAAVTTRTSGTAGASATTPPATIEGSTAATPAIVTRTSGAPGGQEAGDD